MTNRLLKLCPAYTSDDLTIDKKKSMVSEFALYVQKCIVRTNVFCALSKRLYNLYVQSIEKRPFCMSFASFIVCLLSFVSFMYLSLIYYVYQLTYVYYFCVFCLFLSFLSILLFLNDMQLILWGIFVKRTIFTQIWITIIAIHGETIQSLPDVPSYPVACLSHQELLAPNSKRN